MNKSEKLSLLDELSGVEDDKSLCSLLVHDSVSTLTATDRVSGLHLIIAVAFCTKNKNKLVPARVYNNFCISYRNRRKPSKSLSPTLCCCWALGQTCLEVVLKSLNALITIKILFSEFHVLSPFIFCLQSIVM